MEIIDVSSEKIVPSTESSNQSTEENVSQLTTEIQQSTPLTANPKRRLKIGITSNIKEYYFVVLKILLHLWNLIFHLVNGHQFSN